MSWTHYRLLMRVENENAREFYMQEAVKSQWSTRQLERQINSFFYERLLSSKNKKQVAQEIQTLESAKKPEDFIRDPYVLEFLGLTPNDDFYESDLEQALITHLQKFLLEYVLQCQIPARPGSRNHSQCCRSWGFRHQGMV